MPIPSVKTKGSCARVFDYGRYCRAFEQRSRWVRENLLLVGELDKYERTLREEWQLMFDRTADEFGEAQAEEEQKRMAQRD